MNFSELLGMINYRYKYLGCFSSFTVAQGQDVRGPGIVRQCARHCSQTPLFGITYGKLCNCATDMDLHHAANDAECQFKCQESGGQPCGGYYATSVYRQLLSKQGGASCLVHTRI